MSKRFIKEVKPYCDLFIDDKSGIAWIEDGTSGEEYSVHPNIDITGSVTGMKKLGYWGKNDRIVRSHNGWYNISKLSIYGELDEIVAEHCKCETCLIRREFERKGE